MTWSGMFVRSLVIQMAKSTDLHSFGWQVNGKSIKTLLANLIIALIPGHCQFAGQDLAVA
jgi:hypothetical protein